jgi:hypothetical protein
VVKGGGDVSFEWPRFCSGWDLTDLVELEVEIGMWRVNFDGCSVGVRAENGAFIKKAMDNIHDIRRTSGGSSTIGMQ